MSRPLCPASGDTQLARGVLIAERLPWPLVFQVLGVVAAVWLVVMTWRIWVLLFIALTVAAAILPAARLGERYRIPRGASVLAVYVAAAATVTLMGRLLWPALSEQAQQFGQQLPSLVANVKGWVGDVQLYLGSWAEIPSPTPGGAQDLIGPAIANFMRVTAGVVGALVALGFILIVAAYVVIDAERLGGGCDWCRGSVAPRSGRWASR